MPLTLVIPPLPADDLVGLLADPHRSFRAYARLLGPGTDAAEAARRRG